MRLNKQYLLTELAEKIDTTISNKSLASGKMIKNLATINEAGDGDITFLINNKYGNYLKHCKASAIIIQPEYVDNNLSPIALITENPRLSLAKLMQLCFQQATIDYKIHPSVQIGAHSNVAKEVNIGPNCVIGNRVIIEKNVCIGAGVVIGSDCVIKENVQLKANVTIYHGVNIGKNTIIHSGTVIGSDGFGYAHDATTGNWVKMLHVGGVSIGDNVEIGSNTSIDRGFMEDTTIGDGVIIDNLVQIGHNVIIGEKTAIAGCVGIAGSTEIGAYCLIGGRSAIAGHLKIVDRVHITATSAVNRSLLKPGVYSSGFPARENNVWKKNVARFQFLDDMAKRIRKLERFVKIKEES